MEVSCCFIKKETLASSLTLRALCQIDIISIILRALCQIDIISIILRALCQIDIISIIHYIYRLL